MAAEMAFTAGEGLAWGSLLVSLVGVLVSLYGLRDAFKDVEAVVRAGVNGPRKLVARAGVRREGLRLVLQLLLAVIALVSVSLPVPGDTMPPQVIAAISTRNLLRLFAALTVTVASIWDRLERVRLVHSLALATRLEGIRQDRARFAHEED